MEHLFFSFNLNDITLHMFWVENTTIAMSNYLKSTMMKKSLLSLILSLCLFGQTFGQWQKAKLPANNAILSLAVDYATSYIYAGSAGNGVYLSADTGATWKTANTGLPANLNVSNILIQNKNIFLATNDGVYKSANNGNSWQQAGLKGVLVKSLTFSSYDTTYYAGTEKGIYLTKNNGLNWSLFVFPDTGISTVLSTIPNFYAGMTAGGLNYSTDYGKSWAIADTGIPTNTIVKALNHSELSFTGLITSGTALLGCEAGTDHGVYIEKSTGNWVRANNGLGSDTIVNSIISASDLYNFGYIPINRINLIGTGKDTGNVYLLHSPAKSYYWSTLNTGIDGSVNTLAMYRNSIFAGGSSLWVLKSDIKYLYASNPTYTLRAVGDTSTFKVFTNDSWFIQNYNDWLTFSPNTGTGDATITVTATPNITSGMRIGLAMMNSIWLPSFYQAAGPGTGIDNASSANITIYPVPVKDALVISFPNESDNTRFAIYNLSGVEMLASQPTSNTTKVNMSGFKPGVYVLKIYSQNTCTTRKIVKQ